MNNSQFFSRQKCGQIKVTRAKDNPKRKKKTEKDPTIYSAGRKIPNENKQNQEHCFNVSSPHDDFAKFFEEIGNNWQH